MQSNQRADGSGCGVIGIVGERNLAYPLHRSTENALKHSPAALAFEWVPTGQIAADPHARLARYAGLLAAPGGAYKCMDGALAAIRYAREQGVPLLGTCAGFQHIVIEFLRFVVGISDAHHEAVDPDSSHLAITALACSLAGQHHRVALIAGTRAARIYGTTRTIEPFFCRYGLNPQYQALLERHGMIISGTSHDGVPRILELPGHPFYLATLYVPMAASTPQRPHPLVNSFATAAAVHATAMG